MTATGESSGPATPELGPWLGVVISSRPRPVTGGVALDDIRIRLATALFAECRREPTAWLPPWEAAVASAVDRTLEWLADAAREAQETSRAPDRVARHAGPDEDDVRIIWARLESSGIPLEEAITSGVPAPDPGNGMARIGGAIEESWLELEAAVMAVTAEWHPRIEAVRRWRRPTVVLWAVTAIAGLAALVAGLVIGGYLAAPRWAAPAVDWWWGLPWP